jgi:glutamyl-tRNA(Gln) amidotransferase subunit E
VPNETRKALPDGTTVFERVLPGPDRMYPDTDSAPIPIHNADIERTRSALPPSVAASMASMDAWGIPSDCQGFILKRNLFRQLQALIEEEDLPARFAGTLLGHTLRHVCGDCTGDVRWILGLARKVRDRGLEFEILTALLPHAFADPNADLEGLLSHVGYQPASESNLIESLPAVLAQFERIRDGRRPTRPEAVRNWAMGQLRGRALGNVPLARLAELIEEATS